ncbi:ABC transporter substrate-binding protein [Cytobacillus sp. FJAT-54145]|uniref:ABC transporter substrate-binding protein n=1 Tax=Cytobacillus spartinae TaxID=3299023 RepID=A0ABW6KCS6_9BACI
MKQLMYFQMRAYFYSREINYSIDFKLTELEKVWYCSLKNVKRKLKQFVNEGKLSYLPGVGRGNPSLITFKKGLKEEIELEVTELIKRDQLEDVIQLLQLPIPKVWIADISKEVQLLFGIKTAKGSYDILRTIISRPITTIDPLYTSMKFETFLIHQLGDTLVVYDEKEDIIRPHLAHDWDVDTEYKDWIFYLRKGVRFHNQSVLTSEDVKYTFERFLHNETAFDWLTEDIIEINCISPYMIQFKLRNSNPFFLRFLGAHNLSILAKNEPVSEQNWIGTGPFKIKNYTEKKLELSAFDEYFLTRPLIDGVEFNIVDHETAKYITSYDVDHNAASQDPINKTVIEVGFRFLAFNFKKDTIVHNPYFREAIFHLADVKRMISDLGRDNLKESSSYFHWKASPQNKDKAHIKYLLDKANYQGEELTIFTGAYPHYIEEAEWLIREANLYGIHFKLDTYPLEEFYDSRIEEADLIFKGEVSSTDYHLSFMGAFLNKCLTFNRFLGEDHLRNLKIHFEQMKQERDKNKRDEIIENVESYIKRENLIIYIYHPIKKKTFDPTLKHIKFESFGHLDFRELWIKPNIV